MLEWTVTVVAETEPADAGPEWYPAEKVAGTVRAENDRLALRKARRIYGQTAAIIGEPVETCMGCRDEGLTRPVGTLCPVCGG